MRKYATRRLIAKNVPINLKGLFEGQNLRFRGRGSRTKAVETVMKSRALRNKYLREGCLQGSRSTVVRGLKMRFNQDIPIELADNMSFYSSC